MPKKEDAIAGVTKALNDLFAIRPSLTPREAREVLKQFRQDIDIMLLSIDNMELMGVPLDIEPDLDNRPDGGENGHA